MTSIMKQPPPNTNTMPPLMPNSSSGSNNNQTFVEKIMIGLDHAPLQFDLRGQLIGAGGANLHYIRNETGAIATLRGRGSMFIEPTLGTESADPMHLYIEHPRFDGLQSAKQLAKNLIETLQQDLTLFHQQQPPSTVVQQHCNPPPTILHPPPSHLGSIQMSVPPPIMSVPPPSIVAQQPTTTASLTEIISKVPPPNLHSFHPPNMIVQQQIASSSTPTNIPPPTIPLNPIQMLHLQGPPPNQLQLSQPPPNMLVHQTQPPSAQLILNPPPPNIQYQYIQQMPTEIAQNNQNQVTIQHIYQSNQSQTHFNPFATQTTEIQQRQATHHQFIPAGQQFFVQGNNAFVVPPPNNIQSDGKECPPQQQSIIFHTHPPPNIMQLPPIHSVESHNQPSIETETKSTNDESTAQPKSPKQDSTSSDDFKQGLVKFEPEHIIDTPAIVPPSDVTTTQLMSVPPPITCVQHIVGNTLITTTQPPNQSDPSNIYSQIPAVSIQQAPQQQQIHLSTQNGQHFFVHAQQWAHHQQPTQTTGFHLTASSSSQPSSNDTTLLRQQQQPQQILTTTTFNPQQLQNAAAAAGLQVQFQQLQPQQQQQHQQPQQQHFIQHQFPTVSMAQLIDHQPLATDQMHFHNMPPSYTVATIHHQQASSQALIDSFVNQPRIGIPQLSGANTVPTPMAKTNIVDTQLRIGQKRKLDEDAAQRKEHRSGIGSSGSIFVNTQQQRTDVTQQLQSNQQTYQQQISGSSSTFVSNHSSPEFMTTTAQIASTSLTTTASHSSSSNAQDKPTGGVDAQHDHDKDASRLQRIHQQNPSRNSHHNQRDLSDNYSAGSFSDSRSGQQSFCYPLDGPRDPRFRSNGPRGGDFGSNYPMRPPPMHMHDVNFPMNRMNFCPPPPPPYGPPPPHFRQW